jgi:hypothetical protein
MFLGHAWLVLLGVAVGELLSRKLASARLQIFRHRFETEAQVTTNPPPQKGLYEI